MPGMEFPDNCSAGFIDQSREIQYFMI